MAFTLQAIKECLFGTDDQIAPATNEKVLAADILETVFSADDGGKVLKKKLQDIVGEYGWTENLAKRILGGIENGIKQGAQMGQAMKDASGRAIEEARDFASEHPYFCALIAVGVLAVLMPWVLEALGFAELGPLEGSFAAWWQSTYGGYVPQESLFAFLQRLGMVWRKSVVKSG